MRRPNQLDVKSTLVEVVSSSLNVAKPALAKTDCGLLEAYSSCEALSPGHHSRLGRIEPVTAVLAVSEPLVVEAPQRERYMRDLPGSFAGNLLNSVGAVLED
jgi:hypothetical protein